MNTIAFGNNNSGFQAGTIHGPVSAEFHYYATPERPETPPNPSILIPFGRDGDFVQRGDLIDQIEQSCDQRGSRTALVGLGGVGKSQLAIEYAYRVRERSSDTWVFWIHASNSPRFEQSFRDIATHVKVKGRQNPKANIFQLVHDWLQDERTGPWTIVLDNVDDAGFLKFPGPGIEAAATTMESANPRQLISYIPHCQHGSVLVTSRSRDAALELVERSNIITIEPMNEKDALQLFQNKLGQDDYEACTAELAAALDYMPLAIVQAAAYVLQRRPRYSLRKYLDEFRNSDKRKADLLMLKGGELRRDAEAKNSILITWQISFDYIRKTRPSASDILSLMSFCDRQGIPEILLRDQNDCTSGDGEQNQGEGTIDMGDGGEHNNYADDNESIDSDGDGDSTQQFNYSNNDRFENDIATLRNFSFIVANEDCTTFEMHRLVQLATLEWLRAHDVYEQRKHQFIIRLCAEFPGGEYENWAKCQMLFPHAQSVSAQPPAGKESMKEWATILYKAAWYALKKGNGLEAEDLSVWAMKARKRIFNKEHEDVIWSKAMVASAYGLRGRWNEAEALEVQVMETRKKKLGEDHPDTLTSIANLASTYRNQGRWTAAEELEVQVIEASKKKLGENHPATLTSIANLASTYRNQGRWAAAEELEVQVIEASKKTLGEDHPDTLNSMANLASTYRNQGRWEAAEELGVQVIKASKKKLGEDYPDTLTSIANLALTYWNQGRWEAAEELGVQVMETRKRKLGEDHPDTLTSIANLASTYRNQCRWAAAEKLEVQVMKASKKKLGEDHPATLTSIANLASTYWNQGRWKAAEELGVQVMETRKRKLGEDHPDTLTSIANLALTYRNQCRWAAAEKLEVQVMKASKKKLGEDHPATLTSIANLASTYWNQGRWKAAEELETQVIQTRKRKLGEDHPDTLTSMANLASIFRNQGRREAAELGVQVMETRKRKLGEDHPDTLNSMNNLAWTFWNTGRGEEAKTLMRHCVQLLRAKLGASHPYYSSAAENLAEWET
ncbi:hypothetical protein QQS21_006139 [Conoideocrella luteorostrata]|uniref:TPR-like protein n=1 Tax=Conoideocrella luteorostrata TaxID=1105319 RepID=A0AAJ0CQY4_9HYPO|nr:hypothetical protein QQS21_006139 [Conoideocrella luteorostrata]